MANYILPLFFIGLITAGLIKKAPVYDLFLQGAKEGLQTAISLVPPLVGLMAAIGMLKASGALDLICFALHPVAQVLQIPAEVLPLALMRPVSGSGSLAMVSEALQTYGADSLVGRIASVIMGGTETTFYVLAVYFGVTKAKDTRCTVWIALAVDLVAVLCACWVCKLFF